MTNETATTTDDHQPEGADTSGGGCEDTGSPLDDGGDISDEEKEALADILAKLLMAGLRDKKPADPETAATETIMGLHRAARHLCISAIQIERAMETVNPAALEGCDRENAKHAVKTWGIVEQIMKSMSTRITEDHAVQFDSENDPMLFVDAVCFSDTLQAALAHYSDHVDDEKINLAFHHAIYVLMRRGQREMGVTEDGGEDITGDYSTLERLSDDMAISEPADNLEIHGARNSQTGEDVVVVLLKGHSARLSYELTLDQARSIGQQLVEDTDRVQAAAKEQGDA